MKKPLIACALILLVTIGGWGAVKLKNVPSQWKPSIGGTVNASSPYVRGMIGTWMLNEGAGQVRVNSLIDNAQTNLSLASSNITWGITWFGKGITITGGELRAPIFAGSPFNDLPSGTGFTFVMWVNNAGNSVFFRKTPAGTNNAPGWTLQNDGAGKWIFRIQTSATQCNGFSNAVYPTTGVWYQMAWKYNGAGVLTPTNYTFYFNGQPVGFSSTQTGTGVYNTDAANPFAHVNVNTLRDHFTFWNRALSDGEIRDLYYQPFAYMSPQQNAGVEGTAGNSVRHRSIHY